MQTLFLPEYDARICYHDLPGREPVCVYLHGLGWSSSAAFPRVVREPRLAPYRSLLIDLVGFGFSDRPPGFPHTLESHAEVVARLLDYLGLRGCHVVGHSMGGSVGIALATARPDLVGSLLVAEGNLEPVDATFSRTILDLSPGEEAYVATGHLEIVARVAGWAAGDQAPGWLGWFAGTLRASDPWAVYRSAAALVGCRLREAFAALPMPRVFVFGSESLPDRLEAVLAADGVPMAAVPGAGHLMMTENPEAFAAIVAGIVSSEGVPAGYRHARSPDALA